jgi:hypothetical protein
MDRYSITKEVYMGMALETGIEMITRERDNQITMRGFDTAHDDKKVGGELALLAASYARPDNAFTKYSRIKQLAIAGALCAAEIDRLRRKGER